jgi:transposase
MIFRDPVTGEKSYQWADKITCRYDDLEKGPIIMEFLKGERTVEEIVEKYHISSTQVFYAWLGKYYSEQETLSLSEQNDNDMAKKSKDDQIKDLKEALKKAQQEAELEKLRARAFNKMIELAEETFNIPIRKKSGTKQ